MTFLREHTTMLTIMAYVCKHADTGEEEEDNAEGEPGLKTLKKISQVALTEK